MPRLVACAPCGILQRIPDVPPKTPMVPARLSWESGEDYVYKDDKGLPVMVPAFDPILEDFIQRHDHGYHERQFVDGQVVQVWQVDQKTWDSLDVVTKVKKELNEQYSNHFEERDEYKEDAAKCYNAHGNPDLQSGCRDFMTEPKLIGKAQYKIDGRVITIPQPLRQYLCHMCPYMQSYVMVEMRRRKGGYSTTKALEHRKRSKALGR